MIVKDWMSREVRVVRAADRAEEAARALWEQDCGMVPVLDGTGRLLGVVTDRDLCMAALLQGRSLAEIPVASAMSRRVTTIRPEAGLADALAAMQQVAVHRLPVVDAAGALVGIVSTNDLLRAAAAGAVDGEHVLRTLAAIGKPRANGAVAAGDVPAGSAAVQTAATAALREVEPVAQVVAAAARRVASGVGGGSIKKLGKKAAKPTAPKAAAKGRAGSAKGRGKKA